MDQVWANWEKIKKAEKAGTHRERVSGLDGIPRHLPALMRAQKLLKKAAKAGLPASVPDQRPPATARLQTKAGLAAALFESCMLAQDQGWDAEALLRTEIARRERAWRRMEKQKAKG